MKQLCALAVFFSCASAATGQWTQLDAPINVGHLWCIEFTDPFDAIPPIGYIGCSRGMLKSWDGNTWFHGVQRTYDVYGIAFRPPHHGSAACAGGRLLVTTNNGTSWGESNTGQVLWVDFKAVSRPISPKAYAVGTFGAFSESANAGNSWATQFLDGYDGTLRQLHFFDPSTGVVVGDGGLILRTEDGEWSQAQSGTSADLLNMQFPTGTIGYVVGRNGVILGSTDAGATWQPLNSPTTNDLYAVHFESSTTGFIAGDGSTLWYTLDGGMTWTPETVGTSLPEVRINAINAHAGSYYAVGNDRLILRRALLVGVEEHGKRRARLGIAPNPAKDRIAIEVPGQPSGPVQVNIFDPTGQKVLSMQTDMARNGLAADIGPLAPGLYICEVRSGMGIVTGRFVKE